MFSSANLIRIRREHGLTQEEVARRSGLATVTISKLEGGRNPDPKVSTLMKLAVALECPLDQFFEQLPVDVGNGGRP